MTTPLDTLLEEIEKRCNEYRESEKNHATGDLSYLLDDKFTVEDVERLIAALRLAIEQRDHLIGNAKMAGYESMCDRWRDKNNAAIERVLRGEAE